MTADAVAHLVVPEALADRVRARVRSGEFASEADVILQGLHALDARDAGMGRWLRTEVLAAWREHEADPTTSRPLEDVRAGLRARHERVAGER